MLMGRSVALLLAVCSACAAEPLPASLVGRWHGKAKIAVNWTTGQDLPVELEIDGQFRVQGKVGDAGFGPSRLKRQPWFMYGLLGNPEFQVCGPLAGALVARDSVTRKSACLILDARGNRLTGAVHSSGSHGFPGWSPETCRRKMWLAAFELALERTE
jgi:hypothetical protein